MSVLTVITITSAASVLIASSTAFLSKRAIRNNLITEANSQHQGRRYGIAMYINDEVKSNQTAIFASMLMISAAVAIIVFISIYASIASVRTITSVVSKYHYPVHHLKLMNTAAKIASYISLASYIFIAPFTFYHLKKPENYQKII